MLVNRKLSAFPGKRPSVKIPRPLSHGEELFAAQLTGRGWRDHFQREFRFHPERKWRFDFADPVLRIAVEIEGGVFSKGAHTRGKGFEEDAEKYNAATLMGWRVFRFSTQMVARFEAIECVALAKQMLYVGAIHAARAR